MSSFDIPSERKNVKIYTNRKFAGKNFQHNNAVTIDQNQNNVSNCSSGLLQNFSNVPYFQTLSSSNSSLSSESSESSSSSSSGELNLDENFAVDKISNIKLKTNICQNDLPIIFELSEDNCSNISTTNPIKGVYRNINDNYDTCSKNRQPITYLNDAVNSVARNELTFNPNNNINILSSNIKSDNNNICNNNNNNKNNTNNNNNSIINVECSKITNDSNASDTSDTQSLSTIAHITKPMIESDNSIKVCTTLNDLCATNENGSEKIKSIVSSNDSNNINTSKSVLSQTKKTPRFPVKLHNLNIDNNSSNNNIDKDNSFNITSNCDSTELDYMDSNNNNNNNNNNGNNRLHSKQGLIKDRIKAFEQVTDLDDSPLSKPTNESAAEGSVFKNQMLKTYSKNEIKMATRSNNGGNVSPSTLKRSQDISGSIIKMDKTINKVSNDIVRIDNVIDKLSNFNRNFISQLDAQSDSELSSIIDTQSNAAQTDPYIPPDHIKRLSQNERVELNASNMLENKKPKQIDEESSDSSTEKESSESSTDSTPEDDSQIKPSPIHQKIKAMQPRTVASVKNQSQNRLQHQDSELSSLPESSICEEPEKRNIEGQVRYFQRQIKKTSGMYKQPNLIDPPKRLVVDNSSTLSSTKPRHLQNPPLPRPRSTVGVGNLLQSRLSTSSSESSGFEFSSKTLSNNSQNFTQTNQSPSFSDNNESLLSVNSAQNEGTFKKNGTYSRYNKKGMKASPYIGRNDDEAASVSGKHLYGSGGGTLRNAGIFRSVGRGPNHSSGMMQSRSYNELNIPDPGDIDEYPLSIGSGGGGGGGTAPRMHHPYRQQQQHQRSRLLGAQHLHQLHSQQQQQQQQHQFSVENDIQDLVDLIRQHLNFGYYDQIKSIFRALIRDNNRDRVEDIIDCFPNNSDRDLLTQLANEVGFGMKEAESIFDMRLSRTDLQNKLRPGLSLSSLAGPMTAGQTGTLLGSAGGIGSSGSELRMVYWRPDLEELLPPPMKPNPRPQPTNLLKSAIVTPESITRIDNHVREVLLCEPTTFTELVTFLTRDCSNDVERVRALFRWITMYDMKHVTFDPAAPNESLIGILRAIKNGQMTYNELFFHLCRYSGIHCQFIAGYSKGAGYRPGMAIKDNRMFRNVWTSVFVAGAWRFVNCNWGARYLTSRHLPSSAAGTMHQLQDLSVPYGTLTSTVTLSQPEDYRYRCDEFYFLTDAKQHIFEHFPDKKRWQLLNRPITLDQFMALPIVKSPFFNANLSFKRNYAETLQTKNGKVTIKINMPKAVGVTCKLENRSDSSIVRGLTLIQVLDLHTIVVTAAPSQPGKFYLSVYVNTDGDWRATNADPDHSFMEMACSFQVHCSEHNYDRLVTGRFPEVGMLGGTPASLNLGLSINPGIMPFVVWNERSTMKMNLTLRPGLRIGHRMMSYERSGQNSAPCDSYSLLQHQSGGRYQYNLRFPIDAFYCLSIFAGNMTSICGSTTDSNGTIVEGSNDPEEPLECVYRLLVDCRRAQERVPPFPRQTSRWVGFRLLEPMQQELEVETRYRFRVQASPTAGNGCHSMAVVLNGRMDNDSWQELRLVDANNGIFKSTRGGIHTGSEIGQLSLYGQFGSDPENDEFVKLLDFVLVPNFHSKK